MQSKHTSAFPYAPWHEHGQFSFMYFKYFVRSNKGHFDREHN
jgi:hypothetical protein